MSDVLRHTQARDRCITRATRNGPLRALWWWWAASFERQRLAALLAAYRDGTHPPDWAASVHPEEIRR